LTSPGIVSLDSDASDSVLAVTTDSSATLEVITGSLSIGTGSSSTFGGPVTVESGASLFVGAGASLQLGAGSTLTDNGTMTFASGDTVESQGGVGGCCSTAPSPIDVGGTLKATDTTFNGADGTITANSGGDVIASSSVFNISSLDLTNTSVLNSGDLTNNTFNMPIYVPYVDVPYLGNNASFTQIEINNGTISSGTLNLNLIGTNASMSYACRAASVSFFCSEPAVFLPFIGRRAISVRNARSALAACISATEKSFANVVGSASMSRSASRSGSSAA
jgi:hypothetical protein